MKTVLYFLSLIVIASCTGSTKHGLSSILNQFVELNEAMGVPKEDVGVIIANVKNAVSKGSKNHSNFFRTVETQCASALAKINGQLKNLANAIADANVNIGNWQRNHASAKKDIKDADENLVKGRKQLAELRKRINKTIMDYKVYAAEADRKLNVVKVLRDIITDELFNRGPRALVQLNKFQEKLSELKGLLNNNSDSLYAPMVSVLLDLATEQNFADQGVLKKILTTLKNLREALENFRKKQEGSLNAEMKTMRKEVKNIKARIRAYRRMKHQASSKMIDAGHYIDFYTHEAQHFKAESDRITDEKNLFVKLCEYEKSIHAHYKKSLHRFRTQIVPYLFSAVQKVK